MLFKRIIINTFIHVKNKLYFLIDNTNQSNYMNCMIEIMEVLKSTYIQFENIYFKYFLYPKLLNVYSQNIGSNNAS